MCFIVIIFVPCKEDISRIYIMFVIWTFNKLKQYCDRKPRKKIVIDQRGQWTVTPKSNIDHGVANIGLAHDAESQWDEDKCQISWQYIM
jgi:hypothetical protein